LNGVQKFWFRLKREPPIDGEDAHQGGAADRGKLREAA
jgi:hypothetical protein